MRTRRSIAVGIGLLAAGLAMSPTPVADAEAPATARAPASDQAPITAADSVTITPFAYDAEVRVLANDVDPDNGNLQICRLEAPDDAGLGVHIWSDQGLFRDGPAPSGSTVHLLEPQQRLATGSLTVTYYACDRELLTPATLTVHVVRITAETLPDRPGVVRFSNPLDYAIDVFYAAPHSQRAAGAFTLGPHGVKDKKVRQPRIKWFAFPSEIEGDGDDPLPIDYGTVRSTGARQSASTPRALTPRQHQMWQARSLLRRPGRPTRPSVSTVRRDDPPAAPVEDAAPTTASDAVTFDYYDSADVRVLANDSDDTPADLAVCWVDVPADSGLYAMIEPWWANSSRSRSDSPDRFIDLGASPADAGTYTLTYYACDKHRMTPGVLTVTVRDFPPVKVRRVAGHPGTLDFINRGYRNVLIHYFPSNHYSEKFHFRVKPNGRYRLHVSYDDLTYFADTKIGPLSSGRIRHLYPQH